MAKTNGDIVATVQLYPTESGGRKGPTPPNRFGCLFEFEGEKFDCILFLDSALSPGATAVVSVAFLYPSLVKPRLRAGSRFSLWELGTIGEGVVQEVI
jgi:hypothetical protein